jgi:hypothetical protein
MGSQRMISKRVYYLRQNLWKALRLCLLTDKKFDFAGVIKTEKIILCQAPDSPGCGR